MRFFRSRPRRPPWRVFQVNQAAAFSLRATSSAKVGQHPIRPSPLERHHGLQDDLVRIQPAVLRGRLQHRVLAADLVGEGRHLELVLHAAHHVQVGHAGLDHHHVGAFGDVQRHFAQGFVAVGRVHLVGVLVGLAQVGAEPSASRNGP
jgi:hypothetical protein